MDRRDPQRGTAQLHVDREFVLVFSQLDDRRAFASPDTHHFHAGIRKPGGIVVAGKPAKVALGNKLYGAIDVQSPGCRIGKNDHRFAGCVHVVELLRFGEIQFDPLPLPSAVPQPQFVGKNGPEVALRIENERLQVRNRFSVGTVQRLASGGCPPPSLPTETADQQFVVRALGELRDSFINPIRAPADEVSPVEADQTTARSEPQETLVVLDKRPDSVEIEPGCLVVAAGITVLRLRRHGAEHECRPANTDEERHERSPKSGDENR
ncbi:MAG TPA: hypothetical protein VF497_01780 [Rudaea sp.]